MTLATSSGRIYCAGERRVLEPSELLGAQGWPIGASAWPASLGVVDLGDFSRSALVRLAGNAMSSSCVGPILCWISQYAFRHLHPSRPVPRAIRDDDPGGYQNQTVSMSQPPQECARIVLEVMKEHLVTTFPRMRAHCVGGYRDAFECTRRVLPGMRLPKTSGFPVSDLIAPENNVFLKGVLSARSDGGGNVARHDHGGMLFA